MRRPVPPSTSPARKQAMAPSFPVGRTSASVDPGVLQLLAETLDGVAQSIRASPVAFAVVGLVFQLGTEALDAVANGSSGSLGVLAFLGSLAWYGLGTAVLMHLVSDVYHGRPADIAGALRSTARRVIPIVSATVVVMTGFLLGLVLLVVPGVFILVRWFAVYPVLLFENASLGRSFARSSEISRGYFAVILLLSTIVIAGSSAVHPLIDFLEPLGQLGALATLLRLGMGALLMVISASAFTLLYFRIRTDREAYDLELLTAQLTPPPHVPASAASRERCTVTGRARYFHGPEDHLGPPRRVNRGR